VFRAIETPGHANHHHAYIYQDVCFSGDIGGIRLQNTSFSNIPTPPPEFHLEQWRSSLDRLRVEFEQENTRAIAPTHFGVFNDPDQHLARLDKALTELEEFIKTTLPTSPSEGQLLQEFDAWQHKRFTRGGDDPMVEQVYSTVNPIQLSVSGIQRYWSKYYAQ
jgi:glyoxylase-like metal-dependent hydrolase (beta-lactamase superfamily II)